MRRKANSPLGVGFLAVIAAACGVQNSSSLGGGSGETVSSGSAGTSSGTQGSLTVPPASGSVIGNQGGLSLVDGSTSTATIDSSATDAFVGCASTSVQAKQQPLDVFLLLDTSYSMDDLVTATRSKWQAVTAGINAFATDPASAGIGVGLSYFPKIAPGFPASCTSDKQCGMNGVCELGFCNGPFTQVYVCGADADCTVTQGRQSVAFPCAPLGQCANDPNHECAPGMGSCGADDSGFDLGACVAMTAGVCVGSYDCNSQDYETASVPVAPLPGNAAGIAAFFTSHSPGGDTPTEGALQGTVSQAKAYASAHPSDTVVVVLATDGQPDVISDATGQCMQPASAQQANMRVAQIAADALAGTPSIKTFGIGTFAPADVATGTATLDQLAMAGGTSTPFIIATSTAAGNTEEEFSAALAAIRGSSLPCDYQVPVPATGTPNFSEINVRWTSAAGAATTVPYVESAAACDPMQGGWYYNVDPSDGGTPTTIEMCSTFCSALKSGSGRVDILLGCQTQRLLPR
jgi:hypothetical protein